MTGMVVSITVFFRRKAENALFVEYKFRYRTPHVSSLQLRASDHLMIAPLSVVEQNELNMADMLKLVQQEL